MSVERSTLDVKHSRLHSWDMTPQEAVRLQQGLRHRIIAGDDGPRQFRTVAAMDVSYDRRSPWIFAGVVILRLPGFELVERAAVRSRARFPYVPGLLSFRESPAGLEAWERLRTRPDCLLCDGHGYAHPRRFGFACHFGLLVDLPTIGCAKRVLVGSFQEPGRRRGAVTHLVDGDEVVGAALRTRDDVAPVFVSVGHRISLATAITTILACSPRFRIPEPIRQAHALVNGLREAGTEPVSIQAPAGPPLLHPK
ncbi:MAG TPA: deoxyribonuclease V [Candidatus Methylomirabilis sp.]|nr:deoxyribonuclease V [Candidatus Methylomirabilis sp.]